ncbi:MAG: type II toxin-antitoxin system RelE/ParE family toxin [Mariprofundaceae bacterium]
MFDHWLGRLRDRNAIAKIKSRLDKVQEGHFGDVKHLGGGVSEMRIHGGAGYRIYFVERGSEVIILLCAGDKSTQQKNIKKAKELAVDI